MMDLRRARPARQIYTSAHHLQRPSKSNDQLKLLLHDKKVCFPLSVPKSVNCNQFVVESVPFLGEMNEKAVVSQVWNFHANSSDYYHGKSKSLFPCCLQDSTSSPFQIPVSTFAY